MSKDKDNPSTEFRGILLDSLAHSERVNHAAPVSRTWGPDKCLIRLALHLESSPTGRGVFGRGGIGFVISW